MTRITYWLLAATLVFSVNLLLVQCSRAPQPPADVQTDGYTAGSTSSDGAVEIGMPNGRTSAVQVVDATTNDPVEDIRVIAAVGELGMVLFVHNHDRNYVPRLEYVPHRNLTDRFTVPLDRHDDWLVPQGASGDLPMYQRWTQVYEDLSPEQTQDFTRTLAELDTRDASWKRRAREIDRKVKPIRYVFTVAQLAGTAATKGVGPLVVEVIKVGAKSIAEDKVKEWALTSQFDAWSSSVNDREGLVVYLPHEPKPIFGSVALLINQEGGRVRGAAQGLAGVEVSMTGHFNPAGTHVVTDANGTVFLPQVENGEQTLRIERTLIATITPTGIARDDQYELGRAELYEIPEQVRRVTIEPGRTTPHEITVSPRPYTESLASAEFHWATESQSRWRRESVSALSGGRYTLSIPSRLITEETNVAMFFTGRDAGSRTLQSSVAQVSVRPAGLHPHHGDRRSFYLGSGVQMDFVFIGPGTFTMGSPAIEAGRYDDEGPQRQVTISKGFWLAKTPTTQEQWQRVMGNNPSHFKGDLNRPVESISWNDAKTFAQRVSQQLNVSARLPSEAEWEYACRAGTTTRYSFGNNESQLGEYAWRGSTQPVARKKPNPWGLYEMHGNVLEWCEDWFGEYPSRAETDPTGPRTGSSRVLRGGSWLGNPRFLRSAYRDRSSPGYRDFFVGVRLALDSD